MVEEVSFIETLLQSWVQFVPDLQATLTEAAGQIFFFFVGLTEIFHCRSTAVPLEERVNKKNQEIWLPCKFLCYKKQNLSKLLMLYYFSLANHPVLKYSNHVSSIYTYVSLALQCVKLYVLTL